MNEARRTTTSAATETLPPVNPHCSDMFITAISLGQLRFSNAYNSPDCLSQTENTITTNPLTQLPSTVCLVRDAYEVQKINFPSKMPGYLMRAVVPSVELISNWNKHIVF
jgi:hypothetical protein